MPKRKLQILWEISATLVWLQLYHAKAETGRGRELRSRVQVVATLPCQSGNAFAIRTGELLPAVATLPCQSGNSYPGKTDSQPAKSLQLYHAKAETGMNRSFISVSDALQLYHAKAETVFRSGLRSRQRLVATLPCQSGNSEPALSPIVGEDVLQLYHAKAETSNPPISSTPAT